MRILRSYLFWTYERGSLHYDVMVTLILLFLFLSPHLIDFHDRPQPEIPGRQSEILVRSAGTPGGSHRFVFEIRADDLRGLNSDIAREGRIAQIVDNLAGTAQIESVKPVKDPRGHVVAYDAVIVR